MIHNSVPMSNDFKRIPYGISDFKQVLEENKYLVDKTMFFEKMELAGNFLFLVRPRPSAPFWQEPLPQHAGGIL